MSLTDADRDLLKSLGVPDEFIHLDEHGNNPGQDFTAAEIGASRADLMKTVRTPQADDDQEYDAESAVSIDPEVQFGNAVGYFGGILEPDSGCSPSNLPEYMAIIASWLADAASLAHIGDDDRESLSTLRDILSSIASAPPKSLTMFTEVVPDFQRRIRGFQGEVIRLLLRQE